MRREFPARARVWDLQELLVVTQGGRAGRILESALVEQAESAPIALIPPDRLVPGQVVDRVIDRPGRDAPGVVRHLAWARALRDVPVATLRPFIPRPPESEAHWMAIAAMLDRVHAELAGEMILFAEVPDRAARVPAFDEADRWQAAAVVQSRYLELLARAGWSDASEARVRALREGRIRAHDGRIVLVGVVELPGVVRAALEACGAPITTLVCAPQELIHRFDAWGRPDTRWGTDHTTDIPESSIRFADDPADQAAAAIETLAEIGTSPAPEDVVIGVPDESVVPALRRLIDEIGGFGRSASGTPASRTRPVRLVQAAAAVAEDPSWGPIGAFVRHPDVARAIAASAGDDVSWIAALDEYYARHVPAIALDAAGLDQADETVRAVLDAVAVILGPMAPNASEGHARLPISAWCAHAGAMIDRVLDSDQEAETADAREASEAIAALLDAMEELRSLAGSDLDALVTASEALRIIADHSGRTAIPDIPRDDAVDMVGWLELASDPARIVIVTGMNEGIVPASGGHDTMVPDRVRSVLGVSCDARRMSRDAYLLELIARQGREARFICGRRTAEGNPLTPSRVLIRVPPDRLGARIRRCMSSSRDPMRPGALAQSVVSGVEDRFPIRPMLGAVPAITSMRVTAFRDYIESPYLFYLTHILGLQEAADADPELTPAGFGSLVHKALQRFASHDAVHAGDPKRIESALLECLDEAARAEVGPNPVLAARVQIEMARARLIRFAPAQANRRQAGWMIRTAEWRAPNPGEPGAVPLDVDDTPMGLRGQIDRIEVHESTGQFVILDYKTSDRGEDPDRTHRRGRKEKEWIDLQLPLYAMLATPIVGRATPKLGYVVVPSDPPADPFRIAPWTPQEIEEAWDKARDIVRAIRKGMFAPVGRPNPHNPILGALVRAERTIGDDDDAPNGGGS